ncbi:MAG: cation diffusion facilitator family transporter [Alphaproteobacteria bacterium]|nr:cation diffusion facilitator family transporter [Alphaproteobacteria bacterium]
MTHKEKLNQYATQAAIFIASFLVIGKLAAWWFTNSLSMQASLIDSLLDVCASIINFFAVKHAARPADNEHRFGHGKLEAIASLGQSIFIAASALWLIIDCVRRLYRPEPVEHSLIGNAVMIIAIGLTLILILFQRYVYKQTKSLAVKSDSLHYQTDFLTSAAVLVSLNFSHYLGTAILDSAIGGGIALYIAFTSWVIFRHALDELMDRELPDEMLDKIYAIVRSHKKVINVHDMRTRQSGYMQFIQMHLDLAPNISLLEAHTISVQVMHTLKKEFPTADILIHEDPFGFDEG